MPRSGSSLRPGLRRLFPSRVSPGRQVRRREPGTRAPAAARAWEAPPQARCSGGGHGLRGKVVSPRWRSRLPPTAPIWPFVSNGQADALLGPYVDLSSSGTTRDLDMRRRSLNNVHPTDLCQLAAALPWASPAPGVVGRPQTGLSWCPPSATKPFCNPCGGSGAGTGCGRVSSSRPTDRTGSTATGPESVPL
jgi:hypothetical protein